MLFAGGVDADNSVLTRIELLGDGFNDFASYLLIGNPSAIYKAYGFIGGYIHNILSSYQFFGFAFMLMCVSFLLLVTLRLRDRVRSMDSTKDSFLILIGIYTLLSMIFSKFIGFFLFWFYVGYFLTSWRGIGSVAQSRLP
jgi:hypothetical protein